MNNKIPLKRIEEKLEADKKIIEETLKTFADKDQKIKGDWDSRFPVFSGESLEDSADEVEQYEALLPVEFSLETRLKDINIALDKIDKGKSGNYGICELCKKQIPEDRLTVYPEARNCSDCQKRPFKKPLSEKI
ncbi:MAG: TraR/DksA family transcriptional regulator [bacterium]